MARLEELAVGAIFRETLTNQLFEVVYVKWYGSDSIVLGYKDLHGRLKLQILYRSDEPRLEAVEPGLPWSYDGNGALFRLASEAHRICLAYLFDPPCSRAHLVGRAAASSNHSGL